MYLDRIVDRIVERIVERIEGKACSHVPNTLDENCDLNFRFENHTKFASEASVVSSSAANFPARNCSELSLLKLTKF